MPRVKRLSSYEYIDFEASEQGVWKLEARYYIDLTEEEHVKALVGSFEIQPDFALSLPVDPTTNVDVSIRYWLMSSSLSGPAEIELKPEWILGGSFRLDNVVPLENLEILFRDRENYGFNFEIIVRQSIQLRTLLDRRLISDDVVGDARQRVVTITSNVSSQWSENNDLPIKNYRKKIGNFDHEVIHKIAMFAGSSSGSWLIEVDAIPKPFDAIEVASFVADALRLQSRPVLERVPTFLRQAYPVSREVALDVVVIIPELHRGLPYKIVAELRDPKGDLYYATDIPELNQCIRATHLMLLEFGVPLGPGMDKYQLVLCQLLLYRHNCATLPGYVDPNIVDKTEIKGFHEHLRGKLEHELDFITVPLISEPQIGNSQVDLLLNTIPAELKLEDRKHVTTDGIVARYQAQAADYVARQGAPFGFLVVLDTVLDREQPTSPVGQDIRVVRVPNVSGGTTVVVAIVVRVPRSASDHTEIAKKARSTHSS